MPEMPESPDTTAATAATPAAHEPAAPVPATTEAAAPASDTTRFADLGLHPSVVEAVAAIGYESASPIQAATIPPLMAGRDILGQAQTGTGKTAAFALPILSRINISQRAPQAIVMVPTRELAIQVAEAFQKYATRLPGFHVLPIYGGQSYTPQLIALKRGPHVIVGTPGRIIDHLDRGTLSLETIRCVVLDEADEMLAMGFTDAIDAILGAIPKERQVALFSATLSPTIRRIAKTHQRDPFEIAIRGKTATAANIKQSYWLVSGMHKLDALTRIVEVAEFDAMLVFVRTKQATVELAERLQARGVAAVALNGDIPQNVRERTVQQLKAGKIDILVATDVAARGLDVDRITHVVNFDVPYDTESYVHRIGRTGRAGRSGEAILFIAPRERNLLRLIERHTRQTIEPLRLPTVEDVNVRRLAKLKARIGEALAGGAPDYYRRAIEEVSLETGADLLSVGAAVLSLVEGVAPVAASKRAESADGTYDDGGRGERNDRGDRGDRGSRDDRGGDRGPRDRGGLREHFARRELAGPAGGSEPARGDFEGGDNDFSGRGNDDRGDRPERAPRAPSAALQFEDDGKQVTYRLAVGRRHGVLPGNIVGAIANESGLTGQHINGVDIRADHSFVRLPAALPQAILDRLSATVVKGQALNLEAGSSPPRRAPGGRPSGGPASGGASFGGPPSARPFTKPKPHRKGKPN
jgi:ATP-dependent RNA helicase DeaD